MARRLDQCSVMTSYPDYVSQPQDVILYPATALHESTSTLGGNGYLPHNFPVMYHPYSTTPPGYNNHMYNTGWQYPTGAAENEKGAAETAKEAAEPKGADSFHKWCTSYPGKSKLSRLMIFIIAGGILVLAGAVVGYVSHIDSLDECLSSPCMNGGTCTDHFNGFKCGCAPGFTGLMCEQAIDGCSASPCLNGGTCAGADYNFACNCVLGYTGGVCQTNINDCEVNPCLNGATCTDLINSYQCVCTDHYEGDVCQTGPTCGGCRQNNSYTIQTEPICVTTVIGSTIPCCGHFVQNGNNCVYDPTVLDAALAVTTDCASVPSIPQGAPLVIDIAVSPGRATISRHNNTQPWPVSQPIIDPRIIGGQFATYGQFPWQVILVYQGFFLCGASVIGESWVLTAAHCVDARSASDFVIIAGAEYIGSTDAGQVVRSVTHVIMHESYDFPFADMALLKVDLPFVWTTYVKPSCLPRESYPVDAHAVAGATYLISGHGAINAAGTTLSDQLKYATVVIKQIAYCESVFGATLKHILCVDSPEGAYQSSCNGDSGGPLTYENVQLGVTSFGAERCEIYPFGYTDISPYLEWIYQMITSN